MKLERFSEVEGFHKIIKDKIEIGVIHYKVKGKCAHIYNIEIYEEHEGKGYGRTTIETIRDLESVSQISGNSVKYSVGFWTRLGAKFQECTNKFTIDYSN